MKLSFRQLVVKMLKAMGHDRGVSTLMITHDDHINQITDRVLFLRDVQGIAVAK